MGYPSKMQMITRGNYKQWVINLPAALALAMKLNKSEIWEWEIVDNDTFVLKRKKVKKS